MSIDEWQYVKNESELNMKIEEILNNIKDIFKVKTDKEIAELMGIETSNLSKIKTRNSIPYKELFNLCEKNKIDINSLIYGQNKEEKINFLMKINEIVDNSNEKELEVYYYLLMAEQKKLKMWRKLWRKSIIIYLN